MADIPKPLASKREGRVLFGLHAETLIALHAFFKKTQKTPAAELHVARQRMKEIAP